MDTRFGFARLDFGVFLGIRSFGLACHEKTQMLVQMVQTSNWGMIVFDFSNPKKSKRGIFTRLGIFDALCIHLLILKA